MLRQKRQFIRAILFIGILMQAVLVIGAGQSVMAASSKKTKNTLILHNKDGSQYKKIVTTKSKVTLPTMAKKYGYTFLGWSKKKGTNTNPQYEVGESIKVSGTVHLYPVYFKRSTEEGLDVSNMTSGYDEVIFVGDSRIRLMQDKLESRYGKNAIKNVSFVAQGGSGLSWLKSTGIQKLRKLISEKKAENENVRIAVIFNHGVNDVKHKLGGN